MALMPRAEDPLAASKQRWTEKSPETAAAQLLHKVLFGITKFSLFAAAQSSLYSLRRPAGTSIRGVRGRRGGACRAAGGSRPPPLLVRPAAYRVTRSGAAPAGCGSSLPLHPPPEQPGPVCCRAAAAEEVFLRRRLRRQ